MSLDSYAHGVRTEHEIFSQPNQVVLTMEECSTPEAYRGGGIAVDPTMPMWRVQTEGYSEGHGQLMGVVSNDEGFLDSPDTEWMSGGVNKNRASAIAIGRHGNFLHWGFAASPTFMTDEAKLVFINAIHYIAKFDGQTPVARKVSGSLLRTSIERILASISEEGYARTKVRYAASLAKDKLHKQEVKRRLLEAGTDLSEWERTQFNSPPVQTPGRYDLFIGAVSADVKETIGGDETKIRAFFGENRPFLFWNGPYRWEVDEELKSIGIPNDQISMLDRAIGLLRGNEAEVLVGRKLLARYTEESFVSVVEWENWLSRNRELLFFTEAGGYKWLVNATRQDLELSKESSLPKLSPSQQDPLDASLHIKPLDDGRFEVTLNVQVLEGWHTYDVVEPGSPYKELTVGLILPEGLEHDSDWTLPPSKGYPGNPKVMVLDGAFAFQCIVDGEWDPADPLRCILTYQVCDASMCLPVTKKELVAATVVESRR